MKGLLKRLFRGDEKVGISHYYKYNLDELLIDKISEKPLSILKRQGMDLQCNSDDAIIHAFKELLLTTYSSGRLMDLNMLQNNKNIGYCKMEQEKNLINTNESCGG